MMHSLFSLENKKILVTGASSGLGLETCKVISELGGSFIGVARREDALGELLKKPGLESSTYIKADLSKEEDLLNIVEQVGELDGIVHSAGTIKIVPLKFYKMDEMKYITSVNYDSIVFLINALLKKKKIKKGSSIVLIASISAGFGAKGHGYYAGTKAALIAMAKTWANELAGSQIRINCVSPGIVRTEMTIEMDEQLTPELIAEDEKKYPLGYGKPIEIAAPISFLLSDASSWITGHDLIIDGGRTAVI